MLLWHRKAVILKGKHVALNGFAHVRNGGFPAFALRDATGKTRALSHPEAVFPGINDHLSHSGRIRGTSDKLNPKDSLFHEPGRSAEPQN